MLHVLVLVLYDARRTDGNDIIICTYGLYHHHLSTTVDVTDKAK